MLSPSIAQLPLRLWNPIGYVSYYVILILILSASVTVFYDNVSATYLAANPVLHARTKHIEMDFHFLREKVANGDVIVRYISSTDHIAEEITNSNKFIQRKSYSKTRSFKSET